MKQHCNKPKLLWILIVTPGSVWALQHPEIYWISNASAMYNNECWKWKPRALLAFVDLACSFKNPGGYRKKSCYQGRLRRTIEHLVSAELGSCFPCTAQRRNSVSFCQKASGLKSMVSVTAQSEWSVAGGWRMVRERSAGSQHWERTTLFSKAGGETIPRA